jgi:hypothetical protein
MKKILFSAFALFLMVSFSSCRETTEEKTEETTVIEETVETTETREASEMAIDTTAEVVDSTQAAVKEIQK